MRPAAITFALPGRLTDRTGGTIYDRSLIDALRAIGHPVDVLELQGAFPFPSDREVEAALSRCAEISPDTVLIMDGLALGALPGDALCRLRAPIMAMLHHPLGLEPGLDRSQARGLIESERAALAAAAHVLVPSPHVAKVVGELFAVPASQLSVARPGVTRPAPVTGRTDQRPADPPLILSVGLLHRRKGHDILLDALAQIKDLPWQAKIVGRAHDRAEFKALKAQIGRLDLSARVCLTGEISSASLVSHYQRATLFALATRYEGYGLVFDEALLHGLPILSCEVGAVPQTVPKAASHLVAPDDPQAFAAALRTLLTRPEKRSQLSKAAFEAGRALPDWTATAQKVSAIISRLQQSRAAD